MAVKSIEERLKEYQKLYEPQQNKDIAASNAVYDAQKQQVTEEHNTKTKEAVEQYDKLYNENNVQHLVDERDIAENMASLGLSDSGFNKVHKAGAEAYYENMRGKIDKTHSETISKLSTALADAVKGIEHNKQIKADSIKNSYYNTALKEAQSIYKADLAAETAQKKAELKYRAELLKAQNRAAQEAEKATKEASYIIKANKANLSNKYTGTLKDNGITVRYENVNGRLVTTYVDTKSGYSTTLNRDTNPYTGTVNKDLLTNGKYDPKKAFGNGYQPNNINGKAIKQAYTRDKQAAYVINDHGYEQRIHMCNNRFYIWNGNKNIYEELGYLDCLQAGVVCDDGKVVKAGNYRGGKYFTDW